MKVLIVTDQCVAVRGNKIFGSQNFTETLKRISILGELHLCIRNAEENNIRHQIFNDDISAYVSITNITFIKKSQICPSLATIKRIKKKISEVDLVIGYIPSLNAEISSFLTHKERKKFLAFMVGCTWDGLWNQDWKRKIAASYRFLINKVVLRNADYALYVTNYFLQKRYPAKTQKLLGLSDVVLKNNDEEVLAKRVDKINQHIVREPIKIATTGATNVIYKGQRYVLEAMKKLKDRGYKDYEYYIIGGGDNMRLRRLSIDLGVQDQVRFIGTVTHEKVIQLLDEVDIYIQPSLTEGLPRSLVEGMSRALPCIGTRVGAIPELLDDNYLVKKKSSDEILDKIIALRDKSEQITQSRRNFEESMKYNREDLDYKRTVFFHSILKDFQD